MKKVKFLASSLTLFPLPIVLTLSLPLWGEEHPLYEEEGVIEEEMEGVGEPSIETRKTFERFRRSISNLAPSERLEAWQEYLKRFPDSVFMREIREETRRIEEEMYGDITEEESLAPLLDAAKQEVELSEPLSFISPNTRKKIHGGFEYGYPGYFAFEGGFEYAFMRTFSLDTSFGYPGDNVYFSFIPKYAFIKTKKYDLLLSAGAGAMLYINPVNIDFPIYLGFGKIFSERFDLQAVLSTILSVSPDIDYPITLSIGGYYHLKEMLTLALESYNWVKFKTGGSFLSALAGVKFSPIDTLDINLGISVPYYYRYYDRYTVDLLLSFVLRI